MWKEVKEEGGREGKGKKGMWRGNEEEGGEGRGRAGNRGKEEEK